jgi:hypothetical protein
MLPLELTEQNNMISGFSSRGFLAYFISYKKMDFLDHHVVFVCVPQFHILTSWSVFTLITVLWDMTFAVCKKYATFFKLILLSIVILRLFEKFF